MSPPHADTADSSGEWFPDHDQSASQAVLASSVDPARRERLRRVVVGVVLGMIAFTLLGIGSYAWRQHAAASEAGDSTPATR